MRACVRTVVYLCTHKFVTVRVDIIPGLKGMTPTLPTTLSISAIICLLILMCCVAGIRRDANERKRQMKKDATKLVFIVPGTEKKQPLSSQETTPPV